MKVTIFAILTALAFAGASGSNASENIGQDVMASVVKIFSVRSKPNYYLPWQNYQTEMPTGSGFVISGDRIITNAHIVANQTFMMVRKQGDAKKHVARLLHSGHDCDLAVLTVDDRSFFQGVPALEIGGLPSLQDSVTVLGYPVGGDNISITKGVVSRIEPTIYTHSGRHLLSAQIDAAINPGNSGGPVVKDGKVVGVAFQNTTGAENMGFMIPPPVINHFLKDVQDNVFNGFPDFPFKTMEMENPALRDWAKMRTGQTGVMIVNIPPLEKDGPFKLHDVILSVDGTVVSNAATIPFRNNEVIFFSYLFWEKFVGDACKFRILRDGAELELEYKLKAVERLVQPRTFDTPPVYYVFGGLLFVPLTQNYLDSWGGSWWTKAPREMSNPAFDGEMTTPGEEVVVLSEVLADDVNIGYQGIKYQPVTTLNGEKVRNIRGLMERIEKCADKHIILTLKNHSVLVVDREEAVKAGPNILKRYRIPSDRSKNLSQK